MQLGRLHVENFRNLRKVTLLPDARVTAFVGDNGQGKTNLLEAVHLAAALRPLRQVERARELITFGEERGQLQAMFSLEGPLDIDVQLEPAGRRALLAGKPVRDVAEIAARIGVIAFTPEDLTIVRGAPERRRRALDQFAFGLRPSFAALARRYEQALQRRNHVLRAPRYDSALLDSYTEPLVEAGVELSRARADAAARWAPEFHEATNHITGGALSAHLHYQPSFLGDEGSLLDEMQAASHFRERLQRQADAERVRKTTLSGPHLDDLTLEVHERKARRLASQGEARALVLALKIASVRLYRDVRGTAPLLLLDDVAGELDPTKARCLFETAAGLGAQTFVTATHTGVLPALKEAKIVQLRAGQVVE